ncbi:uncharacterized protein CANTADRAFT_35325, partial [Suhomyces tanzawaensis NRRL Y-17324]
LVALVPTILAYPSNIKEVNNLDSPVASVKTPQDLLFSGNYVCDKFASIIQSNNDTTDFPVSLNLYVAQSEKAPNDNYTVDLYFKNVNHRSLNLFAFLNVSDSDTVLQSYNPQLISQQPNFGVEFKFDFAKGLLCNFLYQFTIAYQLQRTNDTSYESDKIFLVGSCQENEAYFPEAYGDLIDQGYRCVEYNSGYQYEGGKDWCSKFYPSDQCCQTFQSDELASRNQCPPNASGASTFVTKTSASTAST